MTAVSDFIQSLVAHAREALGPSLDERAADDHSTVTREAIVARLTFADEQSKADLLAAAQTNTQLLALLGELVERCPRPLLILSVRSDHGPDGDTPHSHQRGAAVDLWHADWNTVGDEGIREVLATLAEIAREDGPVYEVGLGGCSKNWNPGGWPAGFDLFDDNASDHVHVSAALSGHAKEG